MQATFSILHSRSLDKLYIGHTTEAVEEAYGNTFGLLRIYIEAKDWQIVYTETFASKELAYRRELLIKNWKNRKRVIQLIAGSEQGRVPRLRDQLPQKRFARVRQPFLFLIIPLYASHLLHPPFQEPG